MHDLKMLPKEREGRREVVNGPRPAATRAVKPARKRKITRKRSGLLKKALKEAFDILDEIFV